jgi:hypothetical protein
LNKNYILQNHISCPTYNQWLTLKKTLGVLFYKTTTFTPYPSFVSNGVCHCFQMYTNKIIQPTRRERDPSHVFFSFLFICVYYRDNGNGVLTKDIFIDFITTPKQNAGAVCVFVFRFNTQKYSPPQLLTISVYIFDAYNRTHVFHILHQLITDYW